jgi:methionine-rich copper-binding protein CopC
MGTIRVSSKPILALLLSVGILLFAAVGTVSAHAKVIDANPKMGSTIPNAPTTVTVTTAENMKPGAKFSDLYIYGPSGDLISQGDATVSLNNPKQMSVNIKGEGKGVYVVRWVTVSADDGDPDQGAFIFTVGAPAATSQPATASSQASTTQTAPSASGTPIWVPIVVGVIALLVGLGAGLGLGRNRAATATIPPAPSTTSQEQEPTKRT